MKLNTLLMTIFILIALNANSQSIQVKVAPPPPLIKIADAMKYAGLTVDILDTVYSYKSIDDTLKVLQVGRYLNESFPVFIKGKGFTINFQKLIGSPVRFWGKIGVVNQKPQMIITDQYQILN